MAAAPNYAYAYGTTPAASGGQAALFQAIKSMFLGVNTTCVTAVTITGSQAVTPGAMTNIGVGTAVWINWGASDQEVVSVTATTGSTFTAVFTKTHAANYTVGVGLNYQNAITNPWSLSTYTGTDINACYQSSATTAAGDADFVAIIVGSTTTTNISLGTANDIDNSGTNSTPRFPANYNGTTFSSVSAIQAQGFAWWIVISEFSIWITTNIGGSYSAAEAGSCMTAQPTNARGVGIASGAILSSATSVTVTPDISSRISVGQNIFVVNQSHSSSSSNWASAPVMVKVTSCTGTGTTATIGFAAIGTAFDTGALVGSFCLKYAGTGTAGGIPTGTAYFTMFLDGSETGYTGQTVTFDTSSISTTANTNGSPTLDPNGYYLGELQLPLYQITPAKYGIAGFMYGAQMFTFTGVSPGDVMVDPTGTANVWKMFAAAGSSQAIGMGPLLNAQNTLSSMTPVGSTPWVP